MEAWLRRGCWGRTVCVSAHPPGGSDLAPSLLLGDKPEGTQYPISGHTFLAALVAGAAGVRGVDRITLPVSYHETRVLIK